MLQGSSMIRWKRGNSALVHLLLARDTRATEEGGKAAESAVVLFAFLGCLFLCAVFLLDIALSIFFLAVLRLVFSLYATFPWHFVFAFVY